MQRLHLIPQTLEETHSNLLVEERVGIVALTLTRSYFHLLYPRIVWKRRVWLRVSLLQYAERIRHQTGIRCSTVDLVHSPEDSLLPDEMTLLTMDATIGNPVVYNSCVRNKTSFPIAGQQNIRIYDSQLPIWYRTESRLTHRPNDLNVVDGEHQIER